jgi:hypothetical protein
MSGLSRFSAVPEGRSCTLRGIERTAFALMQQFLLWSYERIFVRVRGGHPSPVT